MCNRRDFIKTCSSLTLGMLATQTNLLAFAPKTAGKGQIIIKIFLRGGCDALNLLAPLGDKNYEDARAARLKVSEKDGIKIKGNLNQTEFALHPSAQGLADLYNSGQLAFVHSCGLVNGTRSHFDAQDLIEKGITGKVTAGSGWLARYLATLDTDAAIIPAAHIGQHLPLSFLGDMRPLALGSLEDFELKGDRKLSGLLKSAYQQEKRYINQVAISTLANIKTIQDKLNPNRERDVPDYQPAYPYPDNNDLAKQLKTIAQLLKLEVGLRTATVDMGGWDTHEAQADTFKDLVGDLSSALTAFYNDVNNFHSQLTVIVMSEFGRRLKANESNGTDHGHGGLAMVLGGKVKGGKLYGQWKGLATEQLDQRVDLAVTTDYRTILSELLLAEISKDKLGAIFPQFEYKQGLGLI